MRTRSRMTLLFALLLLAGAVLMLTACMEHARYSVREGSGPDPVLPPPNDTLVPTVDIAPAVGWGAGAQPQPAPGLAVNAFATGLDHPRWLHVLPNGDVLVAESAAPAGSGGWSGLRAWVMGKAMKKAGSAVPSADRITLLRDVDRDGRADVRSVLLQGLHSPFGMQLVGDALYVANADALWRFPYRDGVQRIAEPGTKVVDLPAGMNHHWTKNVIADRDGRLLYVTVGSNSNVAENGMEVERDRAAIHEVDPASGRMRLFASGLRNPNGMDWQPDSGELWTVVNERDEIGSDLVPDYMTSVHDGDFFGWPYSWYGQHVDERVQPQRPQLVARARVPDYALGPHTASLGLVFYDAALLPQRYRGGAFVGQHGSWNRKPQSGYKVVFVPFSGGEPSGPMEDVLTGFLDAEGNARGRPVGVAVATDGALLVADDVGNAIWRVVPAQR